MKLLKKVSALIITASVAATSMLVSVSGAAMAEDNTYKVLLINFDPVFDVNGKKVKQHDLMEAIDVKEKFFKKWNDPYELADQFADAMSEISYGNVNYTIAETIELNELPTDKDGNSYTTEEYYDTLIEACNATGGRYWSYPGWRDSGFYFDYEKYFEEYDVYEKVNSGAIDEVWFFAGPVSGTTLFESMMTGKDAFWVNGNALVKEDCRNFITYRFNYERGLGEMLEDAGHRAERIMDQVYGKPNYSKDYSEYNDWEKFTAYDLVSEGNSGVGNVHFSPNSKSDYDWGNPTDVQSYCDNWLSYPDLSGEAKTVNCSEWGNGDIAEHHKWWFRHLPHAEGKNEETGIYNNWWKYFSLEHWNAPEKTVYDINDCTFSDIPAVTYSGSAAEPAVTVKNGDTLLLPDKDYTISYLNNNAAGTATAVINGINDYTGTKSIDFTIQQPKAPEPNNAVYSSPCILLRMLLSLLNSKTIYRLIYQLNW